MDTRPALISGALVIAAMATQLMFGTPAPATDLVTGGTGPGEARVAQRTVASAGPPAARKATTPTADTTPPTLPYADVAPALAPDIVEFDQMIADAVAHFDEKTPLEIDRLHWETGFLDSGAPADALEHFWRPGGIVQCESGFRNIYSDTGDAGYGQVNQVHRDLISEVSGNADWSATRLIPYWNGYVSGVLVKRAHDAGRNPFIDWKNSGHCHGLA